MIKFSCKNCGQRISVNDSYAGKKGRCPKCKMLVVVPQDLLLEFETKEPQADRQETGSLKEKPQKPSLNLTFIDSPRKEKAAEQPAAYKSSVDEQMEELQRLEEVAGTAKEPEPIPERKFPWLIDIFLYPISKPGLTIIGIVIGIPLLISIFASLLGPFYFFITIPGFFINIVVILYMYWYLCHCVRDSAEGNIRAPDVLASSPSIGDMFFQTMKVVVCLLFFSAPMIIYYYNTRKTDVIFWLLFGFDIFFLPMGLLSVVMFDSMSGLSPVLLIGSILSTFFQYIGLVLLFSLIGWLIVLIFSLSFTRPILGLFVSLAVIYLSLVTAHILGRFHWRNQEKLRWDV